MSFATRQDVLDIQNEMPWEERDRPETLYQMLQQVAEAHPAHDVAGVGADVAPRRVSLPEVERSVLGHWIERFGRIRRPRRCLRHG